MLEAVQGVLDTTKRIVATDSAQFGAEITKYVDSQGAGRPRDKRRKQREKGKGKAKLQTARDQNAVQAADLVTPDEHALWPLIRQVKVWCKADALSTGAILVAVFFPFQFDAHRYFGLGRPARLVRKLFAAGRRMYIADFP